MACSRPTALLILALLACLMLLAPSCAAQFGGKQDPPPKAPIIKGDLKFIRCQVCEAVAKQALKAVKQRREALKAGQKLSEGDILDDLDRMCDPDTDPGDWLTHMDVVEDGDKLRLEDTGKTSECNSECRTVARACDELLDKLDLTDLSEVLYLGKKQRAALTQWLCYDESQACAKKPPPIPRDRQPGPAHVPMDADAIQRRNMMRSMKAAGMSGTMYDRDSLGDEMERMKAMGLGDDDMDLGLDDDALPGVPGTGADDTPAGLTSDLQRAAGAIKEGAAKVADAVGSVASSVYDTVTETLGGKKAEKPEL